jgi:hypothetical protein
MRTRLPLAALACLLAAVPAASAATSEEAVTFLNGQRAANEIPGTVAVDEYRTTGCRNHNHYMALNGGLQHGEEPGKPGYTDEGADYSNSGEVLAQGGPGWSQATNPWDAAPLHQTLLFDPRVAAAGSDSSDEGFECMRLGFDYSAPPMPVLYAYTGNKGRVDVPFRVVVQGEGPYAPQEAVGIEQGVPTGPNILFFENGFGDDRALSATLTGPDGVVDTRMVDSQTPGPGGRPPVFQAGGDLIPVQPLEPSRSYQANVVWENAAGEQMTQVVDFKTAAGAKLKLTLSRKLTRTRKTRLKAPAAAVGRSATLRMIVYRRVCSRPGTRDPGLCTQRPRTVVRKTIKLRRSRALKVPRPPRHGSVLVKVGTASFTAGGVTYERAAVSRRYR